MDEIEQPPGELSDDEARLARFSGVVGEVQDPLGWGLDLEDESLTGLADDHDPTCERFVRTYRCFTREALEVETLRSAVPADDVEDVVRAACSGALAAPLHADIAAPVEPEGTVADGSDGSDGSDGAGTDAGPAGAPDFADGFQDYRSAMRALVAEVDGAPLHDSTFTVDGEELPSVEVTAREIRAVYVPAAGRALVVTGPADLVERVDVVTRPVRALLPAERPDRNDNAGGPGPGTTEGGR